MNKHCFFPCVFMKPSRKICLEKLHSFFMPKFSLKVENQEENQASLPLLLQTKGNKPHSQDSRNLASSMCNQSYSVDQSAMALKW